MRNIFGFIQKIYKEAVSCRTTDVLWYFCRRMFFRRGIYFIIFFTVFSLTGNELDFKKLKLNSLTKNLKLTENEQVEMELIIDEEAVFNNEKITIRPDKDGVSELIKSRLLKLDNINQKVNSLLDDERESMYYDLKAEGITDKFSISISEKINAGSSAKLYINEVIFILRRMSLDRPENENRGNMMPPQGGDRRGGGFDGRREMQNKPPEKKPEDDLFGIFVKAVSDYLNDAERKNLVKLLMDIRLDFDREFTQNNREQPAERRRM